MWGTSQRIRSWRRKCKIQSSVASRRQELSSTRTWQHGIVASVTHASTVQSRDLCMGREKGGNGCVQWNDMLRNDQQKTKQKTTTYICYLYCSDFRPRPYNLQGRNYAESEYGSFACATHTIHPQPLSHRGRSYINLVHSNWPPYMLVHSSFTR
jgi:hypothetical protein